MEEETPKKPMTKEDELKSVSELSTSNFGFNPCTGVELYVVELEKRVAALEKKVG